MKTIHLIAGAFLATTALIAPSTSFAATDTAYAITVADKGMTAIIKADDRVAAKRGRGRGRGGDDDRGRDRSDDNKRDRSSSDDHRSDDSNSRSSRNDDSGSGRSRPRIPGGSGCDDPRDLIEHPEYRG